jgi:KDO2-lipid IV(A) lauroyltransferase
MVNVLNYISYLLIRFFMGAFAALPMSFGFAFARALGVAGYYLTPGRRKVALENLELALGAERSEEERERIAKEAFVNAVISAMEFIHCDRIMTEWKERFSFEGDELIDEMIQKKKGFFVFGGHLGAWMLIPIFPTRFLSENMPGNVVIRPQRNPYFDRHLRTIVEKWRGRMINTRGTGDLIEELVKKGEMVGFYMDQEARREQGVFVEFFGRPASSHVVPPYLAWKHDIPMFPYWMVREAPGRVKAVFKPPIKIVKTGNKDDDIRVSAQNMVKAVEDAIRLYPEQWFWVHRRWKRKVDGSDREERKEQRKRRKARSRLRRRGAYVTSKDVSAREAKEAGDRQ